MYDDVQLHVVCVFVFTITQRRLSIMLSRKWHLRTQNVKCLTVIVMCNQIIVTTYNLGLPEGTSSPWDINELPIGH